MLEGWGCELVQGDVTEVDSLRRAVDGVDAVVHLVAIIKGKPADFQRVMEDGTASARRGRRRRPVCAGSS